MVAFIRQLHRMSPEQYKAAVASAPKDHEEMMKSMEAHEKDHAGKAPAQAEPDKPATAVRH